jgi:hypothetical protein
MPSRRSFEGVGFATFILRQGNNKSHSEEDEVEKATDDCDNAALPPTCTQSNYHGSSDFTVGSSTQEVRPPTPEDFHCAVREGPPKNRGSLDGGGDYGQFIDLDLDSDLDSDGDGERCDSMSIVVD